MIRSIPKLREDDLPEKKDDEESEKKVKTAGEISSLQKQLIRVTLKSGK